MPIFNHVLVIFGCSRDNRVNSTSQGTITSVPLVYALLSYANQKQYATVFQAIVTVGQRDYGISKYEPRRIVSDPKEPVIGACTEIFPHVKIVGCFYLLARSIRRLMQAEVFQNLESCYPESEVKNYFEMLLTLAFVPTKDIPKIFQQLEEQNPLGLGSLFDYFDEKYIGQSSAEPLARKQVTADPPFLNTSYFNPFRVFIKGEHDRVNKNANEALAGPCFREQTQAFSSLVQTEPPFCNLSFWNAYTAVLNGEHRLNNASEEWHDRFSRLMSRQHQNLSSILSVFQEEQWLIDEIRYNILYSGGAGDLPPRESWNSSQSRLENIVRGYRTYDKDASLDYLVEVCGETSQLISEKEVSSAVGSNQALQNNLSIYVQNAGGMGGKWKTFLHKVLNTKTAPDVIVILESWLKKEFHDSNISMPGFALFRRDRDLDTTDKTTGGGIIVYVKQEITCRAEGNFSSRAGDILSIQFSADNRRFLLFAAYIPPLRSCGATNYKLCFSQLSHMIDESSKKYPFSNILLCGDFNLPGYQLTSNQNEVSIQGFNDNVPIRDCAQKLEKCVNEFKLLNCFGQPNECGNTLDMIFTSVSDAIIKLSDGSILKKNMYHSAYAISIPCKGNKLNSS